MFSKKARIIINVITIAALAVLLYFSWDDITRGLEEIGGADWSILLLMIPLQIINFYSVGMLYKDYFKATGQPKVPSRWQFFKIALELNFVNHVFPSGGVAGFSYLGVRLKEMGIPVARTTLAQVMRFALTFISFLALLFFGLFLLSFDQRAGGVTLFIALSIAFLTLFGSAIGVYIISDNKRIQAFTGFLPKLVNTVFRPFTRNKELINISKVEKLFGDLHQDYDKISKQRSKLKKPLIWSLLINISEVATIYVAYLALGQTINPGAAILAYSVASFAGLVSVLPGGIGIYEALMTATLASAGVPSALALSATLIYRIFTIIIFIPLGFVLYQIAIRKGEAVKVERPKANIQSN
jgi:uncharacterized protein (TIRG00374 family)